VNPNAAAGDQRHGTHEVRFWFQAVLAVAIRPWLWWTAARQFARTIPPGWWRHPPFVPWPDAAYLRFRMETAYGTRGRPTTHEFLDYLTWARRAHR
jgi:hypothetical protein